MPCPYSQLTLTGSGRDLLEKARSLDLVRLAAWHAFEQATVTRAPVSTSTALTHVLLEMLEDSGVLTSAPQGKGSSRALYDAVSWTYHRNWPTTAPLQAVVRAALVARATEAKSNRAKLQLWTHLAEAEAESYLAYLSLKRGLKISDPGSVIARLGDEWGQNSLARKRYLIWVATKEVAASPAIAENQDLDLADEISLRSEWLASRVGAGRVKKSEYCFIPESPVRTPTLLTTMQEYVLPIGQKYWTEVPADYFNQHLAG